MTLHSDFDQATITYFNWSPDGAVKASVVIAHGLGEHAKRYDRLAKALNAKGIEVFAIDHRGHGESKLQGRDHGDFGEGGWNALCADTTALLEIARATNKDKPLVLIGHSMGSFAAQQIVQTYSDKLAGLVLSGSSCNDKLVEAMIEAGPQPSGFSLFNAPFHPARTDFDWLSRDEAEVDKYVEDPWCGFDLTDASTHSMLSEGAALSDPNLISRIRSDLPVLLMAGDKDPLNAELALLHLLKERWQEAGIARIDTQFYEGARHEILNEINREEVTDALVDWICDVSNA
jgi:alpha-beta hydrolase superfamily lysophospholipase